jgi:hypothetical protein
MPQAVRALLGISQIEYTGGARPFYMVARPGFFGGFASWLDLFSPLTWNYAHLPEQVDYDSAMICLDWQTVGMDMRHAISKQPPMIAP